MYDMEALYLRFRENESRHPVSYQDGRLTITLSSGEVRIQAQQVELLRHGKVYAHLDWDEKNDPDDLVELVDVFAATLERMSRSSNETYQTADRAAMRRCSRASLFMGLAAMGCLTMLGITERIPWLLAFLACPLVMVVLLAMIRRRAFRRYWVCPQCGLPLPLMKGKLLPKMEYTARCPHCSSILEEVPSSACQQDDDATAQMDPDPAPPSPGSPWPARICGWLSVAFVAVMALLLVLCREPGSGGGIALGLVVVFLSLLVNLPLLVCHAPGLPTSIRPLVVVRESRLTVWVGILLWLFGASFIFGGAVVTIAPPLEVGFAVFMAIVGLAALFVGDWMLLAHRNRALYIWEEPSLTRVAYISSWGRLHLFAAEQISCTRLTFNSAIHLLEENEKKLASVETNMSGAGRLLDWLGMQDLLPTMTPAMQNFSGQKVVSWREEYRTRWHNHLTGIRVGMWITVILLGIGGILPAALFLKNMLPFIAMIRLLTIAPLPFFAFCFIFSPVLLFGDRPKGATAKWNDMHIKVPFVWLLLFALLYLRQTFFLWAKWSLPVAGDGMDWIAQAFLLAAVLIALAAVVTPQRLRRDTTIMLGILLPIFSLSFVYGVNLMLSGPPHHYPLVVVDRYIPAPEDDEEYTLTIQMEDGSETKLYVFENIFEMAMSGDELVVCQRESPLGMVFVDIHTPKTK